MRYIYDTADYFLFGDELVPLPFVTYIHRRDPALQRWEIFDALVRGKVPERYVDRGDFGPMSKNRFWQMVGRFQLIHEGGDRIVERKTGLDLMDWEVEEYQGFPRKEFRGRNLKYPPLW
jgi:hypothetical protein